MASATTTLGSFLFGISLAFAGSPNEPLQAWERFRSLAAPKPSERSPELKDELRTYLASLTIEDLLTVARQGCVAGANKPTLTLEWERRAAAQSNALLCLEAYFAVQYRGKTQQEEGQQAAATILDVVADSQESACLRGAILARLSYSENSSFQAAMAYYPAAHASEVDHVLNAIILDHGQETHLRVEAISALKRGILRQIRSVYESDPNLQRALSDARKQSDVVVTATDLVRSEKGSITAKTGEALVPTLERMRGTIGTFGGILANPDEPFDLRQEAKKALESYRRSAITKFDGDIDAALERAK